MSKEASNSLSGQGSKPAVLLEVGLPAGSPPQAAGGAARVQRPDRVQMRMQMYSLEALLEEDHPARVVWDYVEGLELGGFYDSIRAVEGRAGRDAIDPRVLMALWLYATLEGVGSARQLDRLSEAHVAYQWICGGVSVNYHTLSDFRTAHVEWLDRLLSQGVAGLMHEGLVTMKRVAQDGMRVRAHAGTSSFRRGPTLERLEQEAQQQVEALRKELRDDPGAANKRQQAARERARRERQERIARARRELPQVEARKRPEKKDQARASTTDPQARFMKMADGGIRPAVNVQLASDTQSQIITGVEVGNVGSDMGQMCPMIDQHQDRYGQPPGEMLVDGGFAAREDIDSASRAQPPTVVYAPVQKSRKEEGKNCYERQPADTDAVAQWRQRMSRPEAQEIYKQRAATAECVNAQARNRGMRQFLVRGLRKIKAVVLWFALAHNLMRAAFLRRPAGLAIAGGARRGKTG
jgi:transposase